LWHCAYRAAGCIRRSEILRGLLVFPLEGDRSTTTETLQVDAADLNGIRRSDPPMPRTPAPAYRLPRKK
jgi:hypothetical protein